MRSERERCRDHAFIGLRQTTGLAAAMILPAKSTSEAVKTARQPERPRRIYAAFICCPDAGNLPTFDGETARAFQRLSPQ